MLAPWGAVAALSWDGGAVGVGAETRLVRPQDGHPDSLVPPKTTNMVFQASIAKYSDNVGLANPGISAVIAREAHKQQRR